MPTFGGGAAAKIDERLAVGKGALPCIRIRIKMKLYDARRKPLVRRKVIERRYDVSARTLDNWMKARRIPFIKVGGLLLFSIEKCDKALERFEIRRASGA
jgi:hypothetical protein